MKPKQATRRKATSQVKRATRFVLDIGRETCLALTLETWEAHERAATTATSEATQQAQCGDPAAVQYLTACTPDKATTHRA